jgi:hypothetical protein
MQPLREGGSLPALAEADDGYKYVVKFKGTGHGIKTLIAELLGGEIARKLGLNVPELVFAGLDECFGRTEGDEEIQDLLKASQGLNLGLKFLPGAFAFDPAVNKPDPLLASSIVWLDSLLVNPDRSFKNTNLLIVNKELWLIDHGSCLYYHYRWDGWENKATEPFQYIKDHVLLSLASQMEEADAMCREFIDDEVLHSIVQMIPDEWIHWESQKLGPEQVRTSYFTFLNHRLRNSKQFIKEAHAAQALI